MIKGDKKLAGGDEKVIRGDKKEAGGDKKVIKKVMRRWWEMIRR